MAHADMAEVVGTFRPDLFAGRTILVTGGSSGIGPAMAQSCARLGGRVIALGSSKAKLASAGDDGENADIRFEKVDVRDPARSRPSVLIDAAGIARPTAEFEDRTFNEMLDALVEELPRISRLSFKLET